jgi:hypothetical protein
MITAMKGLKQAKPARNNLVENIPINRVVPVIVEKDSKLFISSSVKLSNGFMNSDFTR